MSVTHTVRRTTCALAEACRPLEAFEASDPPQRTHWTAWLQVYKRVNVTRSQEEYQLWGEWDTEPGGDEITDCLQRQKTPLLLRGLEPEPDKSEGKWWI